MSDYSAQSMLPIGTLEGKTAIITAGGTGMGKKMAEELARLGCNIVIASRKKEVLEEAADEISKYGTKIIPFQVDVRTPDKVQELVDYTVSEFKHIDILVNNAAGNFVVESLSMSDNAWNAVV